MATPDPNRLGGLRWAQRTQGVLTPGERRHLLAEIVKGQGGYLADRIRNVAGRVPAGARDLSVADLRPPDSAFARNAEEACREQSRHVIGHSYRTWVFGSGLATLDQVPVDPELFYVACLLHDHGIDHPIEGQDFTLRSAERAQRCAGDCGLPDEVGVEIGDAITVHATAGITPESDGSLGVYVQTGALYDLAGLRVADLSRDYRADAIKAHPRDGITGAIRQLVRAEARANPKSRFALLHRCGLTALFSTAPHRPR